MVDGPTGGIVGLINSLLDRADELADALAARVRSEYSAHGSLVPFEDLRATSRSLLRNVLRALAGRSAVDTTVGEEIGRRRAEQKVSQAAVLEAHRAGFRFIWETLAAEAAATGRADHEQLVAAASSIWDMQGTVIAAVLKGHREFTAERLAASQGRRSLLLEALVSNRCLNAEEVRAAGDVLGMPRYGRFVVLAAEVVSLDRPAVGGCQQALRRAGIHAVWHLRSDAYVGVVEIASMRPADELVEILKTEAVARIGMSPFYEDLCNTGENVRLATVAMHSARTGGRAVTVFDESLMAVAAAAAPDISRRLARSVFGPLDGLPEARREMLLDTLEAWLDCGGSVDETAKRIYCHPNTVRARLGRISDHTGRSTIEPRGIAELCFALQALRQGPATDRP